MMEQVVDAIISIITDYTEAGSVDGGCSDILEIESIYFGDIGVLPVDAYPCFTVMPVRDTPNSETTSYEIRDLSILVTLLIDARAYFNASVDEAEGDRLMVQVIEGLRNWFRKDVNRSLAGLAGVREVKAPSAEYNMQLRGGVTAKAAQVMLLVNQQRPRQRS